jgi:protein SCO1/2
MVYDKFYTHKDFRITSYTVDPERDTIAALNAYGEELGIDPSIWYLMTGDAYDIQKVSYHSYIQANVKDSLSLNHSQQFVLIGKDLHIRGLYDGTDSLSVTMLMEDVELLLNE